MKPTILTIALNSEDWTKVLDILNARFDFQKNDTLDEKYGPSETFLIQSDPNNRIPDGIHKGLTPLTIAVIRQKGMIFKALLDNKADIKEFLTLILKNCAGFSFNQFLGFIKVNFNTLKSHKDSIAQMLTAAYCVYIPKQKRGENEFITSDDCDERNMNNFLWDLRDQCSEIFGKNRSFSHNNFIGILPTELRNRIAYDLINAEMHNTNWQTYTIHCHPRADLFTDKLFMEFMKHPTNQDKDDYLSHYLFAGIIAQFRNNANLITTPTKIKMLKYRELFNKDEYRYHFLPVFQEVINRKKSGTPKESAEQVTGEIKSSNYARFNLTARKEIYAKAANLNLEESETKDSLSINHYRRVFSAHLQ